MMSIISSLCDLKVPRLSFLLQGPPWNSSLAWLMFLLCHPVLHCIVNVPPSMLLSFRCTCIQISLKLIVKIYVHLGMNISCIAHPWQSHFKLLVWPTPGLLVRHLVTAGDALVHRQMAVFPNLSFCVGLRWALWDFTPISNALSASRTSATAWKTSIASFECKWSWTESKRKLNWSCIC